MFKGRKEVIDKGKARPKLGEMLLAEGIITEEQLREALEVQRKTGQRIGEILVQLGYASPETVFKYLAKQLSYEQLDIPFISLSDREVEEELIEKVPFEVASRYKLIPVSRVGRYVMVAMADPFNDEALRKAAELTGFDVLPAAAAEREVMEAIERYYGRRAEAAPEREIGPASIDMTFESFIPGEGDEAKAACMAVCEKPLSFNPLLVVGDVGTGKTHLLRAIANEVGRRHPGERLLFISSLDILGGGLPPERIEVKFALIDDLQLIERASYEEQYKLCRLLDLNLSGVQFVMAGTFKPGFELEESSFIPELRSRLGGGLIVRTGRLSREGKIKLAIRYALERHGYRLSEAEALTILPEGSDVRRVFESVNRYIFRMRR